MKEITQEVIYEVFYEQVKPDWDLMYEESGFSTVSEFVMKDKEAMMFLTDYKETKGYYESKGFKLPDLVEGLSVEIS